MPVPEFQTIYGTGAEVVVSRYFGKAVKLATVPFSFSVPVAIEVSNLDNVEAIASGANKSAISTAQALLSQFLPDWIVCFQIQ
jgi:hypothetical protein